MRAVWACAAALLCGVAAGDDGVAAAEGLLGRLLPASRAAFSFEKWAASECAGNPVEKCFGYRGAAGGTVVLGGTSGVEMAMALHHYLKYTANCSVSWWRTGGDQLRLPTPVPRPPAVFVNRSLRHHYYANVVTFSYSFVWYTLADWVREIDWMALHGVTLPLAYTGQERVYQKVYRAMGVTDAELAGYFAGPAFLAWNRGQNLQGWGGPLPQEWIDGQWALQREILPRMRAFGMTPVLPAFQGNVPKEFARLFPAANVSRVGVCKTARRLRYSCAAWLDALDPLFNATADRFMAALIEDFGTDHYYAADGTFSHAAAPWKAGGDAAAAAGVDADAVAHSRAAFAGMTRTDPAATWIFQTWSWVYGATPSYTKGWITAVPTGRLILLDLMAESTPIWKVTEGYYGAPFIWCMLHNFGGNDGMWGDIPALSFGPPNVTRAGLNVAGTGLTMEGTNQNAVVYDFMSEMAYRGESVTDLPAWGARYAHRRYGVHHAPAAQALLEKAWVGLVHSVYNATGYGMMVSKDSLTAIPFGSTWDVLVGSAAHWYNETAFVADVWKPLLDAGGVDASVEAAGWTYRHDLADVTRQALAKYSAVLAKELNASFTRGDAAAVQRYANALAELCEDADAVVRTVPGFLLGPWVAHAERWGGGDANRTRLMRWNALRQVTFWEYPDAAGAGLPAHNLPGLTDYAAKHWGGLLATYYAPRWRLFGASAAAAIAAGTALTPEAFHTAVIDWFAAWEAKAMATPFPTAPDGDTRRVAAALYTKYSPLI